jgi:predicted kinase
MRLIIVAGSLGVGKSHTTELLAERLPNAYWFDSELYSKQRLERAGMSYDELTDEQRYQQRLESHKSKAEAVMECFEHHETVLIDTCFDLPETRPYLLSLRERGVEVIIVELVCAENIVHERIFAKPHDHECRFADSERRWEAHRTVKARWVPIEEPHMIIDTGSGYEKQIEALIERLHGNTS